MPQLCAKNRKKVMNGLKDIERNGRFLAKMTIFGPKGAKREFPTEIQKCHFYTSIIPQLCAKTGRK